MHKIILVTVLIVLFIILLFAVTIYFENYVVKFWDNLKNIMTDHSVIGAGIFIIFAALSVLLGPFSSSPLAPFATAIWGILPTFIFLFIGWIIGDTLAYAIGRYAGRPLVAKLVGEHSISRWVSIIEPHMKFPFLLLFRIATPAETGYIFGLLKYRFKFYMALTIIAELPVAIIMLSMGQAFNGEYWWLLSVYALSAILLLFTAYRLLAWRIKKYNLLTNKKI